MNKSFQINGQTIGIGHKPYIIAEISGNHNGSYERLIQLIDIAKKSGADAIKLQTYTADSLTIDSNDEDFMLKGGTWDGKNLYKLYQQAHTPWEWHKPAFEYARQIGLTIFSSPFDKAAVDLLESLNCPAYKIASNEFTDWALVDYVAQTGKPMIMSTGTAKKQDVADTLSFLNGRVANLCILHCVSNYPAAVADARLDTIQDIADSFDVLAGYSDHTLGTNVAVAAMALGACVIEKHITLDRHDGGPDSIFSIEPDELKQLCAAAYDLQNVTIDETMRGIQYGGDTDLTAKNIFQRRFWTIQDIKEGEKVDWSNVKTIRAPKGKGIPAREFTKIIGANARVSIAKHSPLEWDVISK